MHIHSVLVQEPFYVLILSYFEKGSCCRPYPVWSHVRPV